MREPNFCSHPGKQLGTPRSRQKGFSLSQWDGLVTPVAEEIAGLSSWCPGWQSDPEMGQRGKMHERVMHDVHVGRRELRRGHPELVAV